MWNRTMSPDPMLPVTRRVISAALRSFQSRESRVLRCLDDGVVILPVGRAEQRGPDAGDSFDLVTAGIEICSHLGRGEGVEVGVVVGVGHDLVSRVMECLNALGVLLRPEADDEKRGLDVVAVKDVDQRLCILVSPG